jgi:rhamnogalacturonyl hydrolase YesR
VQVSLRVLCIVAVTFFITGAGSPVPLHVRARTETERMAATVMVIWPDGMVATTIVSYQNQATGLWWQVMDKCPALPGNFFESSASAMCCYTLARSAPMGYAASVDEAAAQRAWKGLQTNFVRRGSDDRTTGLSLPQR